MQTSRTLPCAGKMWRNGSVLARQHVNVQKRGIQDVAITRTGKPIIRIQGGRYAFFANIYEDLLKANLS